jgi:hypothetical protein
MYTNNETGVMIMGGTVKYARVTENVLSIKIGAAPVVMKGNVYPVVSEDTTTGNITVLAMGRKIVLEGRLVKILYMTEAEATLRQATTV